MRKKFIFIIFTVDIPHNLAFIFSDVYEYAGIYCFDLIPLEKKHKKAKLLKILLPKEK